MSVHNALAGVLSIALQAKAGHTAIAAGPDTFACGLMEAAATLALDPGTPVLLVHYDEPLPTPYDEIEEGGEALALALLLAPSDQDGVEASIRPAAACGSEAASAARDFIDFLVSGAEQQACGGGRLHVRRLDAA